MRTMFGIKTNFGLALAAPLALTALLFTGAVGCGSSEPGKVDNPSGKLDGSGNQVSKEAANAFKRGFDGLVAHDEKNDWTPATCQQVASEFNRAAEEQDSAGGKYFAEAKYNEGAAYQRCGMKEQAKPIFEEILSKDEKYHAARVQVALYEFVESGEKNADAAIAQMERAVQDSEFKNVEAFVNLAMLQMKRGSNTSDKDGANDFERAKKNLQRALAVQDAYMPAFNQLAVYYLETAKQSAGVKTSTYTRGAGQAGKADTQALELAALVTSQAIQKNPKYAAIHNTAGLIEVELENLSSAVQSFDRARRLDPNFFEAQMNYAAVNLKFRGFEQSEQAYRQALKIRPNDYDAHLGLALALRGQIELGTPNFQQMIAAADAEIQKAKKIDANRPEAWFNEAILTQEFKSKAGGKEAEAGLLKAKELYQAFVQKAGGDARFADAVKDVTAKPTKSDKECSRPGSSKDDACRKGRLMEIDEIIEFNKQTAEMQKQMEQDAKQRAAEEEAQVFTEEKE
jgi:lipoprotein NlpI